MDPTLESRVEVKDFAGEVEVFTSGALSDTVES